LRKGKESAVMTRLQLRRRIAVVVAMLGALAVVAALLRLNFTPILTERQERKSYALGKDLFPLVVAVLATFLASWFQQRSTFVESLRRLWSHMIDAKIDLLDYARSTDRSETRYRQAYTALSRSIDEVRGVYKNVGESDSVIGLFPYEPLHDMRRSLETLGCSPYDKEASAKAIQAFDRAWNSLRLSFLAEFSPPEPTTPVTTRWSRDPRREGDR
jgi:hypothetical protein